VSGDPRPLEQLLAGLEGELQSLGWRARRRALDEARDHLLSAIDDEVARGASPAEAEGRAVALFGEPAPIAATLVGAQSRAARAAWRIATCLALVAAGLAAARLGVHTGVADPGASVDDGALVAIVLMLAGLPWLAGRRRAFGPLAGNWAACLTRIGALGALGALPYAAADVRRYSAARFASPGHPLHAEIGGSVLLVVLMTLYATCILWVTSRRGAASATTVAIGAVVGVVSGLAVYGLAPFGSALHVDPWLRPFSVLGLGLAALGAPLLAGRLAGDRTSGPEDPEAVSWARSAQGLRAGLCSGLVATLIIVLLTLPTMVHYPRDVALKWANPSPNVPHGGIFEVRMSVGDGSLKYMLLLIMGPLCGAALGGVGGDLRRKPLAAHPLLEADRLATAGDHGA
jgi:hypothetical protein